jgi:hypothetical protein
MALTIFKKKEPEMMSVGKGMPIDRVKELSGKGFSEPDMIDVLRKEGYSPEEIDSALTEALKMGVSGVTPPAQQQQEQMPLLPALQPVEAAVQNIPIMPETSLPQNYYQQQYPTEEYVEYLVRERMGGVDEKINEFTIRYEELEKRMQTVWDQLNTIATGRSTEQQQILQKLDVFKDSLVEMETRMGSLEKAFRETLPALIESVRALSDLVGRVKREA